MPRHRLIIFLAVTAICLLGRAPSALWAQPSETLLPKTTKGFLSVADVDELRAKWKETQIGQLLQDAAMKPFIDDIQKQFKEKLSQAGVRLSLSWQDLKGVYSGEVCAAAIQPDNHPKAHAVAMIVDVTGREDKAKTLLKKIEANRKEKEPDTTEDTDDFGDTQLTILTTPPKEGEMEPRQAFYFVHAGRLVASDSRAVIEGIYQRLVGNQNNDALANLPAFAAVINRCDQAAGALTPHLRWFVDPFGYMEVIRADAGGRRRRGKDMLKVFAGQGFDAIQAMGGYVNFATGDQDLLHRTFIYAPPVKREAGDDSKDKYNLAARMLDFPNKNPLAAQDWIPRDLATYSTFSWKMKEAFGYSETLVNEIAGDEQMFEEVIQGIRTDPDGPQIDLPKNFIAHLGERLTVISDYELPITPKSEQMLFAIELTNVDEVKKTIEKMMKSDPGARKLIVGDHVIWEIINAPEEEMPELSIGGPGGFGGFDEEDDAPAEKPIIPNPAITVVRGQTHGYLMLATHVDFLKKVLKKPAKAQTLAASVDYQVVEAELTRLGGGAASFKSFSRTDEEYRPTYELIRQGKMPEAETMLGKLLNGLFGPKEEGDVRKQQIDGTKLPDFKIVQAYLGPAGMFVTTEDDGWFVTGVVLSR